MLLRSYITYAIAACVFAISSCKDDGEKEKPQDTLSTGDIEICVDETYKPIIEEHIKVFDSSYPDANITAHYKPESACIKEFLENENIRMILVTRDLNEDEKQMLSNKKVVTNSLQVAKDAVAVILNNDAEETVFSISQLKGILTGEYAKDYTVVFDAQGSSTVRYMLDSIIPGEELGKNVFAAKNNDSVIQYVSSNKQAIGFVGVSHISDFEDPEGLAFINNVKVASIYNDSLDKAYKPYQAYIAPDWYPLTRSLYYINRETHQGLGTGFAKFLSEQRGQLIFKQARMFPGRVNVIFREAQLNN